MLLGNLTAFTLIQITLRSGAAFPYMVATSCRKHSAAKRVRVPQKLKNSTLTANLFLLNLKL